MTTPSRSALVWLLPLSLACMLAAAHGRADRDAPADDAREHREDSAVDVHYLEIVTPDVDGTCAALAKLHGVRFGEPVAALGNARTAALRGGGRIGVRAPMRETERPVVRPYVLVDDIRAAVETARAAGSEIALPAMEIPGQGTCAVYIRGGIEHGLWQH